MPRPSERTRSKKRVNKTLPGGRRTTIFRGKASTASRCSSCGQPLTGVSNMSPLKAHKLNRSKRRIWRQQGAQLCPNCLKNHLKQVARTP